MNTFARFVLTISAAGALLAACGWSQLPIGAQLPLPQSRARATPYYRVLYRFKGGADGAAPIGDLVDVNGTIYGVTEFGGSGGSGTGTVFALDLATGKEKVIASSLGNPYVGGRLLNLSNILYGAGRNGGTRGAGDVFGVSLVTGKTKSICPFYNEKGQFPNMGLIQFNGALYGTTYGGGKLLQGAVFACDPRNGKSRVVYSFKAGANGAGPLAGLTAINGALYGTTYNGGAHYYGTIFSINPSGKQRVLLDFDLSHGAWPMARLIDVSGTLYGTTSLGGTYDRGTVFKTSKSGAEKVLYSFKDTPDGSVPSAGVTYVSGSLYGTTERGGSNAQGCRGCGTVFQLTASGTETVLHRFKGGMDGAFPLSGLINVKGTLYGATTSGGGAGCMSGGCGTIFEITP
jgi:uncharacterized repeat protein (TIGR03803 family)